MQLGCTTDSRQPQASGKPRIFYGWWLVLLAGLVVPVTAGPFFHSMSTWAVVLEGLVVGLAAAAAPAAYLFGPVLTETGSYILALLSPLVRTLLAALLFLKSAPPRSPGPSSPRA